MSGAAFDVAIVGGGHNGLVAAILLAKAGRSVVVLERAEVLGGAARTERPFAKAPGLGVSTGAYLLGLPPPELLAELGVEVPLLRRDPHYFLPTTSARHLLFGSDRAAMERQFRAFFSEQDWRANLALEAELGALRDDVAPAWLLPATSLDEVAERHVRPALRQVFRDLCRGSIRAYLDRFGFRSDLLVAMYAATDAFSGTGGGFDTPGTGHNFFLHNMCRLPGADGTWMLVRGGMGAFTQVLAARARELGATLRTGAEVASIEVSGGAVRGVHLVRGERVDARAVVSNADPFVTRRLVGAAFPEALSQKLDGLARDGSTFKLNLALDGLPTFTCLPEDRGQFGPTIHLLPDEDAVLAELERAQAAAASGALPEFPAIEWYFHTPLDPSLQDAEGRHNAALFVQWVPRTLASGASWRDEAPRFAAHLLSLCDRFAPDTSARVLDMLPLDPTAIEERFGITRGHIHHVDNGFAFDERVPHRLGIAGLYSSSAGTHPGGAVIGAAGCLAARACLEDLA